MVSLTQSDSAKHAWTGDTNGDILSEATRGRERFSPLRPRSQGGNPDEARRPLAHRPLGPPVAAAGQMRAVGPEDEHGRLTLGHNLQKRVDRMRAADAQTLDRHRQRP